jgi:hypothetical protein
MTYRYYLFREDPKEPYLTISGLVVAKTIQEARKLLLNATYGDVYPEDNYPNDLNKVKLLAHEEHNLKITPTWSVPAPLERYSYIINLAYHTG